jgi:RHS repeat-associated protein
LTPLADPESALLTGPTNAPIKGEIFYPWGAQWNTQGTAGEEHFAKFHQRDIGTSLDYTLNRMYSNWGGRWLTPDPGGRNVVSLDNPQTWNMYAYVQNNPMTLTDPSGLVCIKGITVLGSYFGGRCAADKPPSPPPPPPPPTIGQQWATARGNTVTITTRTVNYRTMTGTRTTETRTGNHPFRDNNPGDVNSGTFASKHGSIGVDKGFAIFPDAKTGFAATTSLLQTPSYQDKTLDDAIATFAPPCCNDTASYQADAREGVGVSGDTKLSALDGVQTQQLVNTISNVEGFNIQGTTNIQTILILPPF